MNSIISFRLFKISSGECLINLVMSSPCFFKNEVEAFTPQTFAYFNNVVILEGQQVQ